MSSGTWRTGETKDRTGLYNWFVSLATSKINAAKKGVVGIPIKADWGPCNQLTICGDDTEIISTFGDGGTVYLSNDGSIYHEPEPVIPPEPYVPTPEELLLEAQTAKKREIAEACERRIYTGVSVTLADGTVEHYSLTEHDQINLFGKQVQLAAGAETLEYHADGQPFRYYSAADMQSIIQAAMWHVSYHTTYCNALNMWIAGCQTADDVWSIFYGADVPKEYRSEVLNTYLLQLDAIGEENETRS